MRKPPDVSDRANVSDYALCANECGACVMACPAQPEHLTKLRSRSEEEPEPLAFGGWHTDKDTHLASSSGGIFSALANHVFEQDGCVFGVVWASKDTAKYTKAETMAELAPMRGSKYTQAIPGVVYREVKQELKKGRQVLFCGTSCQIYAMKRYLRKEYENLLQAYIREFELTTNKRLERIHFRDKAGNWQQYHIKKVFSDGSFLSHCNREDMFLRFFVSDLALNTACYACPHARFPRVGDISLGDFWGNLQQTHPKWPIANGIGSVLTNNEKGRSAIEAISHNISLQKVDISQLLEGQRSTYIRDAKNLPANRAKILSNFKQKRLSQLYRNSFCLHKHRPL